MAEIITKFRERLMCYTASIKDILNNTIIESSLISYYYKTIWMR